MRVGIDLLWVRPGICGGTESFIRNLMKGFAQYDDENQYVLFVAKDNAESFREYEVNANMSMVICNVNCSKQWKRILWENLNLDKWAMREKIEVMFVPVYSKPRTSGEIPYVCVIHDLQALHYPQYFSRIRRMFLKLTWANTCKNASCVVTISDYCKNDLVMNYPVVREKIRTIYNPVISEEEEADFKIIAERYGIEQRGYFYCVSSLLPHKNLNTILATMAAWSGSEKLVISGVGQGTEAIVQLMQQYGIENKVVFTGFVSNAERDALYDNCKLFLFPSVFEGFGMPPIEAMQKGKRVVMTDKSCLKEVTLGKATYVEEPYSVPAWLDAIERTLSMPEEKVEFPRYTLVYATREYVSLWNKGTIR